jgi:hypothetical protein
MRHLEGGRYLPSASGDTLAATLRFWRSSGGNLAERLTPQDFEALTRASLRRGYFSQ